MTIRVKHITRRCEVVYGLRMSDDLSHSRRRIFKAQAFRLTSYGGGREHIGWSVGIGNPKGYHVRQGQDGYHKGESFDPS